ncbi:hypothetical protein V8E55_008583 [Tylopilus felleus]
MQLSPILLIFAAAAVIAAPALMGDLVERMPDALADVEDRDPPNADWKRD